jgi:hypothetical protein
MNGVLQTSGRCITKEYERPKGDFRSVRQAGALMATATLIVKIAAVMVPVFLHRMNGEVTFGTPRRHNVDAGGEKVAMWAFLMTCFLDDMDEHGSLLLLMVRTKALELSRVFSEEGFHPCGDVHACVSFNLR